MLVLFLDDFFHRLINFTFVNFFFQRLPLIMHFFLLGQRDFKLYKISLKINLNRNTGITFLIERNTETFDLTRIQQKLSDSRRLWDKMMRVAISCNVQIDDKNFRGGISSRE